MEGAVVKWYYTLYAHVRRDWKELCSAFVKQYRLNAQSEVSLQELLDTKQGSSEPFTSFLTRWKGKVAQMKYRLVESDQLDISIEACISYIANKLKNMGIRDFKELYHFEVQVEADLNLDIHG